MTVFDAQPRIGGLWPSSKDDGGGLLHPLMVTNQSRNTMHFSDFAWGADDPQFLRAWMVGRYLERYAERYLRGGASGADIRLGWRVVGAELLDDSRWRVTVRRSASRDQEEDEGKEEDTTWTSVFDYLLVASGFFGRPALRSWIRDRDLAVPVIHSSKYRDLENLLGSRDGGTSNGGKKILVVGGQMSGVETAGTIASHLSSAMHSPGPSRVPDVEGYTVHHLIQRPAWVFPLYTSPKVSFRVVISQYWRKRD